VYLAADISVSVAIYVSFGSTYHTVCRRLGYYADPLMSQNSKGHGYQKYDTRAQSNKRNQSAWHISTCDALPHYHVKKKVTASQKQHRTVHSSPVCTECSDRSALMYESETAMFLPSLQFAISVAILIM
jgi:hypothetical protein